MFLCLLALYYCLITTGSQHRWSLTFLAALHNLKLFVISISSAVSTVENKFFFFVFFMREVRYN